MTSVLRQFETVAKLSEDSLHQVWFVRNREPGYDQSPLARAVCFPVSIAGNANLNQILEYEAQLVTQLVHVATEKTLSAGMDAGAMWYVKQVEAHETLRDFFAKLQEKGYETLTVPLAISVISVAAETLHVAHNLKNAAGWSLKISHGGVDFDSIGLTYDGKVRLRDFGVAKALRQAHLLRLGTMPIDRMGYFSPEEMRGKPADAKSDMYSLGVVLWELLTGKPLINPNAPSIGAEICEAQPQPPSAFNAKVTPELDAIVLRALARDPAHRFENCDHFVLALRKLVPDPSKAMQRVPRILAQLFPRRLEIWRQVEVHARAGDFQAANAEAVQLYQSAPTLDQTTRFENPTTGRLDPDVSARLAQEAELALGAGPGSGWESQSLSDFAADFEDNEPTVQTSADDLASIRAAQAAVVVEHRHDEPTHVSAPPEEDSTRPQDIPSGWDRDLAATLPTGVPSPNIHVADDVTKPVEPEPEFAPDYGNPAVTHAAYKPQPMPTPQAPAPDPIPEVAIPSPSYSQPEPAAAAHSVQPDAFEFMPAFGDDDDDEDEDAPFASIPIHEIVGAPELAPKNENSPPVLEIIRTAGGVAIDIATLSGGVFGYKRSGSGVTARKSGSKGKLKFKDHVSGWVRRERSPKEDIPAGAKELVLEPGDAAEFDENGITFHVRCFRPPRPPSSERQWVTAEQIKIYAVTFAISLVFHGLGMVGMLATQYLGISIAVETPDKAEVFAEGKLEKKEKPKPKPKPKKKKPKPKKMSEKKPSDPTEAKAKIPKSVRRALDKRRRSSKKSEGKVADQLAALTTPQKGDGHTLEDVVTNIDAIKRPNGGGGAFNVTGSLGAIEGGNVNIARSAGGSRIGDLGGSVDGGTGKLQGREKSKKVRGKARGMKAMAKVQGTLSRGQVWDVINGKMGRIQACYEKELTKNPNIAGKLTFDWVVKTSGKVGTVKEVSNTLGSSKVSKCVSKVIKSMKFPRPKGGEVQIKFPFIFKSG